MACNHTLPPALLLDEILGDFACELRYYPLDLLLDENSWRPGLRATLLAARLLNEFLVDLTFELRY